MTIPRGPITSTMVTNKRNSITSDQRIPNDVNVTEPDYVLRTRRSGT